MQRSNYHLDHIITIQNQHTSYLDPKTRNSQNDDSR
jgi:hypothetical protein